MKTYLTPKEIRKMIDLAPILRDKVIISFLADTGARVSELLKVTPENIDFEKNLVLIPHLKQGLKKKCPQCHRQAGRRQAFCSHCGVDLSHVVAEGIEERSRLISVGANTIKLFQQYIEERKIEDKQPIINLSRQGIYYLIRDMGQRAGIGKILNPDTGKLHHLHPHVFRASLAVDWLRAAKEDAGKQKALQSHLGHKRFETTMRYHKLAPSDVSEVSEEVRKIREEQS